VVFYSVESARLAHLKATHTPSSPSLEKHASHNHNLKLFLHSAPVIKVCLEQVVRADVC
jgi:hypothetical protein